MEDRAEEIAAVRKWLLDQRSPAAQNFDRKAVCTGTAAQIAVAQRWGRTVTHVFVGYVRYAGVIAASDIRCEPPADSALTAAMVVANLLGMARACGIAIDTSDLAPAERAVIEPIQSLIDDMPPPTFDQVVEALVPLIESGWRDISGEP